MDRIRNAFALSLIGLLLPAAALAAPPPKMQHAMLHVPTALKKNMQYAHVTGSATLTATKMDITINVTAENLPAASTLHKKFYVVWITNGTKRASIGKLKLHGMMGGLKTTTMWHKVQDIIITAENSATVAKPAGTVVLSGMVG